MTARPIDAADLFCGAGGTTEGLEQAVRRLGRTLTLTAVNHWKVAIDTHSLNHAEARNLCTGLDTVDPHKLVPSGRLDLLCASPECTHHSVARGGKPMDDQSRSSAWLILRWAQQLYIKAMIFENVPEWQSWGPLGPPNAKGERKPLKSKRGELFQQFVATLRALGYKVEWKVLNCADYGSPTTRKRLFMICRRDGKVITWPAETHQSPAKAKTPGIFDGPRKPWVTARQIIDWSKPGRSIFGRKKSLAENTLRRIEAGLEKYNGMRVDLRKCIREDLRPYLIVPPGATLAQANAYLLPHRTFENMNADSLDVPLRTVTANSADFCLVKPFLMQIDHASGSGSMRSADDPIATLVTKENTALLEPHLVVLRGTSTTADVDAPMPTVTNSGAHYAAVEPFLVNPNFGERVGQAPRVKSIDDPAPAVTSAGAGGVVQPFVVTVNHGDGLQRRVRSIDEPMATVTGSMGEGIAEPALIKFYGTAHTSGIDEPVPSVTTKDRFGLMLPELIALGYGVYMLEIHFRMLSPRELARAQGFPDSYQFTGNREAVVKQIGNAVPPHVAAALCYEVLSSMGSKPVGKDRRAAA